VQVQPILACWHPTQRDSYMASVIQLLRDKRSSAVIDIQTVEAQLAHLAESAETCGIRTNLRSVAKLYREYIATLDESIQSVN
jgi:hypothetical protein